jgi:hypothetical protein
MMGPVEYLIVEFPGNKFKGEIVPALLEVTASGIIQVIDLIFIKKDEAGNVASFELSALGADEASPFDDLDGEIDGLLSEEDILIAAEGLQPNSSAALLVFEHAWATRLRDAIVGANGRLVDNGRIPREIVEAAMAMALGTDAN